MKFRPTSHTHLSIFPLAIPLSDNRLGNYIRSRLLRAYIFFLKLEILSAAEHTYICPIIHVVFDDLMQYAYYFTVRSPIVVSQYRNENGSPHTITPTNNRPRIYNRHSPISHAPPNGGQTSVRGVLGLVLASFLSPKLTGTGKNVFRTECMRFTSLGAGLTCKETKPAVNGTP